MSELEQSRIESELQFLKLQISPHFFFNILNGIYHSIKIDPEQAEKMVMQLSEIMQYHIYDCSKDKVELSREIKNIQNYIGLQKMRLALPPRIKVEMNGNFQNKLIAPFIFIPFVENAFKHGLGKQSKQAFLEIYLDINENNLSFKIVNSKSGVFVNKKSEDHHNGLINVKKRLALEYPLLHNLSIEDRAEEYMVLLDITIS